MNNDHKTIGPFYDVQQVENALSEPTDEVIATMRKMKGDMIILGVGGKMGLTIARMAKRSSDAAGIKRRIIGVSRFSSGDVESRLQTHGIETVRCDLLDGKQVDKLPEAPNVLYMAAQKFGTTGDQPTTWAINTGVPMLVGRRYGRSRIVVFSSGNVYPLTPIRNGGSVETDEVQPIGEYANSVLGRERIFDYYSRELGSPTALIRLFYSHDMRYGVLVDMAEYVWNEKPIDLSMGHVNVIWQRDANAMTLRAFDHVSVPSAIFNVVGDEVVSVREACNKFGQIMGKKPRFVGEEAENALLGNGKASFELIGRPTVAADEMIQCIADWIMQSGESFEKPTHFQTRDGKF